VPRLTKAHRELAASDPVMAALMERVGPMSVAERRRRRGQVPDDAYGALLRAVVGQQLSTKAARTIYDRVVALFGGDDPSPQALLEVDEQALRKAGLSGRKVEYLRDLAAHVLSGELELDRLEELSDEEVIAEVTAVRGLGQWTAEMFLMFHLGRGDVVSGGDLGIRRGVMLTYELGEMPTPDEVVKRAEAWRPHRTLACIYLWEAAAATPVQ
jgi:DNA-3-methyladenine glycosylase II